MCCTGKELLPRERHLLPLRRVIVLFLFVSSLHLCDGEFRLRRSFTTDDFIQGQLITHSQTNWTIPDAGVPRQITAGRIARRSHMNVSQNMWHHYFWFIKTFSTERWRKRLFLISVSFLPEIDTQCLKCHRINKYIAFPVLLLLYLSIIIMHCYGKELSDWQVRIQTTT